MNRNRIILGGLLGGVVLNIISALVNGLVLMGRYEILGKAGILRTQPRGAFMPVYQLLLFAVGIALTWLYAVARGKLGPGPKTALKIGLVAGLVTTIPANYAQYAWGYTGGFVSMWWTIDMGLGCALATLAGAWVYKEEAASTAVH
jgi:hypothetical protein